MSNNKKCPTCNKILDGPVVRKEDDKVLMALETPCPFYCVMCSRIIFPYEAQRDVAFIWPIPLNKTFQEDGLILRAEISRDVTDELYGRTDYGILLSLGIGHWGKKRFHATQDIKVGSKVFYDKFVPWGFPVKSFSGVEEFVVVCGYNDIKGTPKK